MSLAAMAGEFRGREAAIRVGETAMGAMTGRRTAGERENCNGSFAEGQYK